MLLNNKFFIGSVALICTQQIMLAFSTYFIASAGAKVASTDYDQGMIAISQFFICALVAYCVSSAATLVTNKSINHSWHLYCQYCFNALNQEQSLSTAENKRAFVNWIAVEGFRTLEDTAHFTLEGLSIYLQIILTMGVFSITLGIEITIVLASVIITSLALVTYLKHYIAKFATALQTEKQQLISGLDLLWDSLFNSSATLYLVEKNQQRKREKRFFSTTEKHLLLEQCIAILPIVLAVPALLLACFYSYQNPVENLAILIGTWVAVLPRSLQLFGAVHSMSIINSKVLLIKYKYSNLMHYPHTLPRRSINSLIDRARITIYAVNDAEFIDILTLISRSKVALEHKGRYLVTGDNGSGKSSLLKLIKSFNNNSIRIAPDTDHSPSFIASSGERQLNQLYVAAQQNVPLLLLDEWDANLDQKNKQSAHQKITQLSASKMIIEVRHFPDDLGKDLKQG